MRRTHTVEVGQRSSAPPPWDPRDTVAAVARSSARVPCKSQQARQPPSWVWHRTNQSRPLASWVANREDSEQPSRPQPRSRPCPRSTSTRRPPRRRSSSSPGWPISGRPVAAVRQQRRRLPHGARPGPGL